MTIKEQVRGILEENRGGYISGEELAARLFCTRGAVWKAIEALRKEGCVISAVTNRGYCMEDGGDTLSAAGIKRYLGGWDKEIIVLSTVNSTNVRLRELAQSGAPEGTVVVADCQTSGNGRRGRSFFSPKNTGVYMSILLRPSFPAQHAVKLTSAAAVAAALALEEVCGVNPRIKWVNDIYINGKKAAGILTEASFGMESGTMDYAVVGIGINVCPPEGGFPEELKEIAGAVLTERASDMRNRIAAAVIRRFTEIYAALPDSGYLSEYRRRLMWIGERITVLSGGESGSETAAVLLGVDESCALMVRYDDGSEGKVFAGEISIRR